MPRSQFDQELNKMHVDLARMCHLVVLAIENCVTAFKEQDYELAQDIIPVSYTHLTLPTT